MNLVRGRDSQRFHFAVEMRAFEAQRAGGLRHVPAIFLELAQNKFAFVSAARFVQRAVRLMQAFGHAAEKFGRKVMRLNTRLRANNDETLDEIAQLAHIARPWIARKNFESVIAEFAGLLAIFGTEFIEEVAAKNWNIRDAVTQRRNKKGNYVQAIKKILAKRASRDFFVEVLVGGGDDAEVHAHGLIRADLLVPLVVRYAHY